MNPGSESKRRQGAGTRAPPAPHRSTPGAPLRLWRHPWMLPTDPLYPACEDGSCPARILHGRNEQDADAHVTWNGGHSASELTVFRLLASRLRLTVKSAVGFLAANKVTACLPTGSVFDSVDDGGAAAVNGLVMECRRDPLSPVLPRGRTQRGGVGLFPEPPRTCSRLCEAPSSVPVRPEPADVCSCHSCLYGQSTVVAIHTGFPLAVTVAQEVQSVRGERVSRKVSRTNPIKLTFRKPSAWPHPRFHGHRPLTLCLRLSSPAGGTGVMAPHPRPDILPSQVHVTSGDETLVAPDPIYSHGATPGGGEASEG